MDSPASGPRRSASAGLGRARRELSPAESGKRQGSIVSRSFPSVTTDELLAQVKAGRYTGTFDPVRGEHRKDTLPDSILGPRVALLEALAGVELTASERRTLLWLLDWDSLDNIAAMICKRCEVVGR